MEQLTKEEILNEECYGTSDYGDWLLSRKKILKAMDLFATQEKRNEAIGFARWAKDRFIELANGMFRKPFPAMGKGAGDTTEYTMDQLYDLYVSSKHSNNISNE